MILGLEEEEEVVPPVDRAYWENHGSPATVALADEMLAVIREVDPRMQLKYNKFQIGLAASGITDNFVR
jgi:hypothetical protein